MPPKHRNLSQSPLLNQAQIKPVLVSTNQPIFTFDIAAINRDFGFLCLERKRGENWFGAPLLDKLLHTHQAQSALFAYGNFAFLMFGQSIDLYQIKQALQQQDGLLGAKVKIVQAILEPNNPAEVAGQAIFGHWLAQLLINRLGRASRMSEHGFNNLTGKFYWLPNTTRNNIAALKVEFNFRKNLQLSATNFSQQSAGYFDVKKPNYLRAGQTLRRVFQEDVVTQKAKVFIAKEHAFNGISKKARLPFLSIQSLEGFYQSKMGIWSQLHQRIEHQLGQYLTLKFDQLKITHRHKLSKMPTLMQRAEQLLCKNVCLVDEIHQPESTIAIHKILQLLQDQAPGLQCSITSQTQDKALNIRLVHEKAFYQQTDLVDPYLSANSIHAIQHLSLENWQQQTAPRTRQAILNVCLKEAQLKQDFINQQLTLFDWPRFCAKHHIDQAWWFLSVKYQKNETTKRKAQNQDNLYLQVIKVEVDGALSYETITADCFLDPSKTHQAWLLQQAYECLDEKNHKDNPKHKPLGDLVGLVYQSKDNSVNAFFNSDLYTLPNYKGVETILQKVSAPLPTHWQTPQEWLQQLQVFFKNNSDNLAKADCVDAFENLKTQLLEWNKDHEFTKKKYQQNSSANLKKKQHAL